MMRINSQLPALPAAKHSGAQQPASPDSHVNTSVPSVVAPSSSPASEMMQFESAMAGSQSSRFQRMDELSAKAQSALQAYQNTAAMSSDHPRNQLVGVDVFA